MSTVNAEIHRICVGNRRRQCGGEKCIWWTQALMLPSMHANGQKNILITSNSLWRMAIPGCHLSQIHIRLSTLHFHLFSWHVFYIAPMYILRTCLYLCESFWCETRIMTWQSNFNHRSRLTGSLLYSIIWHRAHISAELDTEFAQGFIRISCWWVVIIKSCCNRTVKKYATYEVGDSNPSSAKLPRLGPWAKAFNLTLTVQLCPVSGVSHFG